MLSKELILEKLKELRKINKKRNFEQTLELIVTLNKKVDVKELKSKLSYITLPHYNDSKVIVIREIEKKENEISIKKIEEIAKSKRDARKFAKNFDFALAEVKLLPLIGKLVGKYWAVRGKMPIAIKDEKNLETEIEKLKKSVKLNIKQNQVQMKVGYENQNDNELAENILHAFKTIVENLPRKEIDVKKVVIKFTMSKPIKII